MFVALYAAVGCRHLENSLKRSSSKFADFCGVDYALTVSNGTTGLHLAIESLGIGPGDEVIVPDLTFVATANVVTYAGAKPIVVDVDPDTLCISASAVEVSTQFKNSRHYAGSPLWASCRYGSAQIHCRGSRLGFDRRRCRGARCRIQRKESRRARQLRSV